MMLGGQFHPISGNCGCGGGRWCVLLGLGEQFHPVSGNCGFVGCGRLGLGEQFHPVSGNCGFVGGGGLGSGAGEWKTSDDEELTSADRESYTNILKDNLL